MGDAIGQMLPAAVGVAISPLPIVAVVLMLVTPRGRVNGPAFVLGWVARARGLGAIVLSVASGAGASDDDGPATWVAVLKLVLGLLLLLLASASSAAGRAATRRPRRRSGCPRSTPSSRRRRSGAGVLLSAVNPKNLLLAVAGAAAIAQTGIPGGEQAVAWVVFILVASVGVAAPVIVAVALGDRSRHVLDELKDWLAANNATIIAVLMVVIGAKLIGDGISGF